MTDPTYYLTKNARGVWTKRELKHLKISIKYASHEIIAVWGDGTGFVLKSISSREFKPLMREACAALTVSNAKDALELWERNRIAVPASWRSRLGWLGYIAGPDEAITPRGRLFLDGSSHCQANPW